MSDRLEGKVALVTGSASGIGRAVADRFASEGAQILLADRDAAGLKEVCHLLRRFGGQSEYQVTDVRDEDAVADLVESAVTDLGGLEVLVHCAAVPQLSPLLELSADDWREVVDINLTGSFICAQAAARRMVERGQGGRIILLSSVNDSRAITGRGAYAAAKGGVGQLTRLMAAELGPFNITVNAIAPGPVDTPLALQMHNDATRRAWLDHLAIQRYAQPEEIASAAVFLASDEAAYITGHTLYVDGGFTACGMLLDTRQLGAD